MNLSSNFQGIASALVGELLITALDPLLTKSNPVTHLEIVPDLLHIHALTADGQGKQMNMSQQ